MPTPTTQKNVLPELGKDGCILEGIVTTLNEDGSVNISPMGPIISQQIDQLILRPFRTSTTYKNLKRTGQGVFHVTDDVALFAQAAIGQPDPSPALDGLVLVDACRWYAFKIGSLNDSQDRTHIVANTINRGRNRDFLGFNRAKHAVIEAAILATRLHLLPTGEVAEELSRLAIRVSKTASRREQQAFDFLQQHINQSFSKPDQSERNLRQKP